MRKRLIHCAAGLAIAASTLVAHGAAIVTSVPVGPITFDNSDYTNNFRELYDATGKLGQAGGVLSQTTSASNSDNGITIYDTTPADATDVNVFNPSFRVSFKVRAAQTGSSIGVILIDPASVDNNLIGLFNFDINANTATDTLRFFKDASLSVASPTGVGTQVGTTITGSAGADANSTFTDFVLDYSVSGTTPTLTLTVGGLTQTQVFAAGDAIAQPQIALRLFDATATAGSTDVDNFAVTAVPEPGTAGIAAVVACAGLVRRRRA